MTTYRIFTSEGKSLRFQGELIASVESDRITTSRGVVWFELNAYERKNHKWVTTIAMRHEDEPCDEVFEFYSTILRTASEDFLYDFDPLRILPKGHVIRGLPENRSVMVTADHSYYAAVRRLIREMNDYDQTKLEQLRQAAVPPSATGPTRKRHREDHWMVHRMKQWLHIWAVRNPRVRVAH